MSNPKLHAARTLTDLNGRRLRYLRLSLTERCNLRCGYCYGSVDEPKIAPPGLSNDQVIRLVRAFAGVGFDKVRFTGGEVLLRPGVVDVVRETAATGGITLVGITTNGLLLDRYLRPLVDAGLNRLNVSLDTLDKERFKRITGVDGFDSVHAAIQNAVQAGVFPRVKINTVIMRGVNDDELKSLAEWALSRKIDLRFIEFMPTHRSGWGHGRYVSEDEMKERIDLPLENASSTAANRGPAVTFKHGDRPGRISFISAVSRSFCSGCNRLRVTSQGDLVGCLFGEKRISLRKLLDGGGATDEIVNAVVSAVRSPGFRREGTGTSVTSLQPPMRGLGG
jgi:cyclic pyranopterin phosphate synthase